MRLRILPGLSLALLAAACSSSGHTVASPSRSPSANVAIERLAVPAVCVGVADCHLELTADVDGDGASDGVAVVGHPVKLEYGGYSWDPDSHPTLRVATGRRTLTLPIRFEGYDGHLVLGAGQVDGVPGNELLVGEATGAHGSTQTVLTIRAGRLVALASPAPYFGGTDPVGAWGADASLTSNLGWRCLPGGRVEEYTAGGDYVPSAPDGIEYELIRQTWRWTPAGWVSVSRVVQRHRTGREITGAYMDWTGCGTFRRYRPYPEKP